MKDRAPIPTYLFRRFMHIGPMTPQEQLSVALLGSEALRLDYSGIETAKNAPHLEQITGLAIEALTHLFEKSPVLQLNNRIQSALDALGPTKKENPYFIKDDPNSIVRHMIVDLHTFTLGAQNTVTEEAVNLVSHHLKSGYEMMKFYASAEGRLNLQELISRLIDEGRLRNEFNLTGYETTGALFNELNRHVQIGGGKTINDMVRMAKWTRSDPKGSESGIYLPIDALDGIQAHVQIYLVEPQFSETLKNPDKFNKESIHLHIIVNDEILKQIALGIPTFF